MQRPKLLIMLAALLALTVGAQATTHAGQRPEPAGHHDWEVNTSGTQINAGTYTLRIETDAVEFKELEIQ